MARHVVMELCRLWLSTTERLQCDAHLTTILTKHDLMTSGPSGHALHPDHCTSTFCAFLLGTGVPQYWFVWVGASKFPWHTATMSRRAEKQRSKIRRTRESPWHFPKEGVCFLQ